MVPLEYVLEYAGADGVAFTVTVIDAAGLTHAFEASVCVTL